MRLYNVKVISTDIFGTKRAIYWDREFWWLGSILRGLGPHCTAGASSRCRPPPSLDIIPSHSFVSELPGQCVSVAVLDNMRADPERPKTHLWMSCLFTVPCSTTARELGSALNTSCPVNWSGRGGNYFGCKGSVMLSEACVWNCFAVGGVLYKAAAEERGGAITEGGLDTPCLANTTTIAIIKTGVTKHFQQWQIWTTTREGWMFY